MKRGEVFYYRAKVPKALRNVLRRAELKYSLGRVDREAAEALGLEMSAAQLRLCRALRQAGPMSADAVDRLVAHYMTSFRANREEDSINLGEQSVEAGAARIAWVTEELAAAEEDLLLNRLTATERIAREILIESGTSPAALGEEGFRKLCSRLLTARVDVMREESKRLPSGSRQVFAQKPAQAEAPSPSQRISEIARAYMEHRDATGELKPSTRIEMVAALAALVSLTGDPAIRSVRARDAQDFARKYSMLPQRWRSKYKGKSAVDVLKETAGTDVPRSAAGTVKKELALIKTFWRWAVVREELTTNAMDAVAPPDTGRAKDKRRPFSDEDIVALRPLLEAQRVNRRAILTRQGV